MTQQSAIRIKIFVFIATILLQSCTSVTPLEMPHGVMAAEVTDRRALIWSRANQEAMMHVRIIPEQGSPVRKVKVTAKDDYTGVIAIDGLKARTRYHYQVWLSNINAAGQANSQTLHGSFQTAPLPDDTAAVSLTWAGDFAGQNVCRDAQEGFPVFATIEQEQANLFIGLGDMIYADDTCKHIGRYGNRQVVGQFPRSVSLENFWAHWRYTRDDKGLQSLTANTAYYGLWDDHEVINDFGPLTDWRADPPYASGLSLMPIGMQAFLDYTPMDASITGDNTLYRTLRYGKHAQIIFLDTRQYRDANAKADSEREPKTMLGPQQLAWLSDLIQTSDATWKIIVSSVPISIPTGYPAHNGRDGWADFEAIVHPADETKTPKVTGFEHELRYIMRRLQSARSNAVFITTDTHFAEVFRYTPFADDHDFVVHEIVTGPGNAGIFPERRFDTSLGTESLFFHGPPTAQAVTSWEQAKTWFNYGLIKIDEQGVLTTSVKNLKGHALYTLTLHPAGSPD